MLDRQPAVGSPERGATQRPPRVLAADLGRVRDVTESRDLRPVREAFLAVLSHELRTPITTIYAGSSVLARRAGLSPSATRSLAADISAEAARLYDLVEDLLVSPAWSGDSSTRSTSPCSSGARSIRRSD